MAKTPEQRFWSKVQRLNQEQCWVWTAAKDRNGYGKFGLGGKVIFAHRFAYEAENGPAQAGQCIMHKCDNPGCVNPSHLTGGTQQDNLRDMRAKNRGKMPTGPAPKGASNGQAKLSEDDVRTIRSMAGKIPQSKVAAMFNIGGAQVSRIQTGQRWKHVAA